MLGSGSDLVGGENGCVWGGFAGALFIFGSYSGHTGGVGDGLGVSAISVASTSYVGSYV